MSPTITELARLFFEASGFFVLADWAARGEREGGSEEHAACLFVEQPSLAEKEEARLGAGEVRPHRWTH